MYSVLYSNVIKNKYINGYDLIKYNDYFVLSVYDMGEIIEKKIIGLSGERYPSDDSDLPIITSELLDAKNIISENKELYEFTKECYYEYPRTSSLIDGILLFLPPQFDRKKAQQMAFVFERKLRFEKGLYDGNNDLLPYHILQNELREKVIKKNELPNEIEYIAGVDVAYNEQENRMVGAIVILDAKTLELVEKASHEMDITFPYVPGLFSFREIPPLLEAYKKIKTKPDLIVCDGQGIAHPKNMGMASHLGLELDIPTVGCAKKRLVGMYDKDKLGATRGAIEHLIWDSEIVGAALRTQDNIKPMFVSIGHKISLETAINWILKLCPKYRQPETTRQADQLVNQLLKERTEVDFWGDENEIIKPKPTHKPPL